MNGGRQVQGSWRGNGLQNLKAIAIRGSNEVVIADRESMQAALANMNRAMKESEVTYPLFSKHGSPLAYRATTEMGIFATKVVWHRRLGSVRKDRAACC